MQALVFTPPGAAQGGGGGEGGQAGSHDGGVAAAPSVCSPQTRPEAPTAHGTPPLAIAAPHRPRPQLQPTPAAGTAAPSSFSVASVADVKARHAAELREARRRDSAACDIQKHAGLCVGCVWTT